MPAADIAKYERRMLVVLQMEVERVAAATGLRRIAHALATGPAVPSPAAAGHRTDPVHYKDALQSGDLSGMRSPPPHSRPIPPDTRLVNRPVPDGSEAATVHWRQTTAIETSMSPFPLFSAVCIT